MKMKLVSDCAARGRKLLLILALPCLLVGVAWIAANYDEVVETFHEATCAEPCPALSLEQLRLQVIKAYLHNKLESSTESLAAGGYMQIVLLQRDFTKEDLKEQIEKGALVRTLTTNAVVLKTHGQIDALSTATFTYHPTIALYSLSRRKAQIIPTRSIQATTQFDIEQYVSNRTTQRGRFHIPPFTWWEKQRGYGQYFFWIVEYPFLDLGCCDGLGDQSQNGSNPHKSKRQSLLSLEYENKHFMFISNRGRILNRYPDG